jgi:hypothetical protein
MYTVGHVVRIEVLTWEYGERKILLLECLCKEKRSRNNPSGTVNVREVEIEEQTLHRLTVLNRSQNSSGNEIVTFCFIFVACKSLCCYTLK